MNKVMQVKCPACEKKFDYYQSEFRPFCSEHCRMIDLGHWLLEGYRIPLKVELEDEEYEQENNTEF